MLIFGATCTLAFSQDWNELDVVLKFKPEYQLNYYNTILIPDVVDSNNRQTEDCVKVFSSINNAISSINNVRIASRDVTELIWKEVERMESGDINKQYRVDPRNNIISSGILFVVRLIENSYEESVNRHSTMSINNCDHYKQRKGTSKITINVKIVSIKTTEVLFAKNIMAQVTQRSSECKCCEPPRLKASDIFTACLVNLEKEIVKTFDNYYVKTRIKFQKDKLFNEELKKAVSYFKIEEYQSAFDLLEQIANKQTKPKPQSSAIYNLALAQAHFYLYGQAYDNAKKAYILNPDNKESFELIDRIKELNSLTE